MNKLGKSHSSNRLYGDELLYNINDGTNYTIASYFENDDVLGVRCLSDTIDELWEPLYKLFPTVKKQWFVDNLFVDPEYRHNGISNNLITALNDYASLYTPFLWSDAYYGYALCHYARKGVYFYKKDLKQFDTRNPDRNSVRFIWKLNQTLKIPKNFQCLWSEYPI